ncbi:MAG: type II secretion system minor pseudopilin GspJ [Chromatiales bacterium]|nr:type II secretion system minor pseudopilin GspJ [Chromatiales bacterium]
MKTDRQAGFTLLELLVTVAVFAVFSVLAIGGLTTYASQQALIREELEQLDRLQRAMRLMMNDITQSQPRCVRDELGMGTEGAFLADGRGEFLLRLTRGGWRNPASLPRGTLQRVQYRLTDEGLVREYWPVLDRVLGQEPRREILLEGLEDLRIDFLDEQDEWQRFWPPLQAAGRLGCEARPRAVRLTFELSALGELQRLVEVPQ